MHTSKKLKQDKNWLDTIHVGNWCRFLNHIPGPNPAEALDVVKLLVLVELFLVSSRLVEGKIVNLYHCHILSWPIEKYTSLNKKFEEINICRYDVYNEYLPAVTSVVGSAFFSQNCALILLFLKNSNWFMCWEKNSICLLRV